MDKLLQNVNARLQHYNRDELRLSALKDELRSAIEGPGYKRNR